jgi:hypothetical protein
MQWKTTNHLVQVNYFGEVFDPGFMQGSKVEKNMRYRDSEHENRMMVESLWGLYSPRFEQRELQNIWADDRKEIHSDPEYQRLSLH